MTDFSSLNLPEGYDLRAFDFLDSSNQEAQRLSSEGQRGPLWIVTAEQSAGGRGRRGRTWVSRPGNLFTSLLYPIDIELARAAELSFVTALAVRDVVEQLAPDHMAVSCKWPNDILLDGQKIAGILLESSAQGGRAPSHIIIGIGINLVDHPTDTPFPASDILQTTGQTLDVAQVMQRLIRAMDHWIGMWHNQGFGLIRQEWKDHVRGLGEDIIVRLPGETLKGRFVDIDPTGALILELEGERRHITAGDVFFFDRIENMRTDNAAGD